MACPSSDIAPSLPQAMSLTFDPSQLPDYDSIPAPDYTRRLDPSEALVDSSVCPPPYIGRPHSSSTSPSSVFGLSVAEEYRALQTIYGQGTDSPSGSLDQIPADPVSRYIYTSGNIELDLGPRYDENRSIPSYGRGSTIKGTVTLKKLSRVQALNITLEGRVQTVIMQAGLPSGHNTVTLLAISKTVYNATDEDRKANKGKEPASKVFPFEFEIPSTIQDSTDPLPPTFRGIHPAMEGWVRYTLKVQAIKTGLWPRETLSVAVHYLPKFYLHPEALLWPSISLMDHKRFGPDCNKWKTYHARLTDSAPTYPAGREPELRISVPRTEQAVSSHCFQVIVYLRVPGASQSELNDYVSKTTVQGLKVMTMMANGSKSAQYVAIGRSYIQQIEKELVEPDARIIRAGTRGGAHEGEATWNVGQLINVEYFVRVSVKPEEHKAPIFQHDVRVHMFTHTRDQYDSPFEAHDAPAYNLLLGCSLSNNLPTIHGA